jgi:prolyl-tRNA synthetase
MSNSVVLRYRAFAPVKSTCGKVRCFHDEAATASHLPHQRYRLRNFFIPKSSTDKGHESKIQSGHELLTSSGYVYQPPQRAGVFHFLPLGNRVLEKLEKLVDKHMRSIGAAKLSLSSISTEKVWRESGRLKTSLEEGDHELFGLLDRKHSGLLLCPTHEEEITMLMAKSMIPAHEFPIRLYQTTRKYRNEARPRAGLLRTKEFIMKDLYSFDSTKEEALKTYQETRQAYSNFFTELGMPFLVAEADSGNMGGNLSHEYHYESPLGEDTVWQCSSCSYTANDEVVKHEPREYPENVAIKVWQGISTDRNTHVHVVYPSTCDTGAQGSLDDLSILALKPLYSDLDFKISKLTSTAPIPNNTIIVHPSISSDSLATLLQSLQISSPTVIPASTDFTRTQEHDTCPSCSTGHLTSTRTIEVGHTFHLGTRYSSIFNFRSYSSKFPSGDPVQMGCYGIGVTRLIGALADLGKSRIQMKSGAMTCLNWPVPIAPFQIMVVANASNESHSAAAHKLYDTLEKQGFAEEVLLDDRVGLSLVQKLRDADQRGVPVVLVVGREWDKDGSIEVQCRGLASQKLVVKSEDVAATLNGLLQELRGSFAAMSEK